MSRTRRHFSNDEKVRIIRRHLIEKVPLSDLCDELSIAPAQFYHWQKEFFENGAAAFAKQPKSQESHWRSKATVLEEKLHRKNEVLSELMEEHLRVKKELGEL